VRYPTDTPGESIALFLYRTTDQVVPPRAEWHAALRDAFTGLRRRGSGDTASVLGRS
jgi:hypothetical protein